MLLQSERRRQSDNVDSTMTDELILQRPDDVDLTSMMITNLEDATPPKRIIIHKIPEEKDTRKIIKSVSFLVDEFPGNGDRGNRENFGSCLPLQLTSELCHDLWYQTSEINAMKQDAKSVLLNREGADPDDLSGLERFNSHRAVWKRSAIYYVLAAQKQRQGEDFIRRVSRRCSAWARETAVQQGFKDYCAVNDPLASLFGNKEENYNDCFFSETSVYSSDSENSGKKRKVDETEMESSCPITPYSRNVRTKTSVAVERDQAEEEQVPPTSASN
jgi:hypothetical protein